MLDDSLDLRLQKPSLSEMLVYIIPSKTVPGADLNV